MMHIILYRSLLMGAIAVVLAIWFYPLSGSVAKNLMMLAGVLAVLSLLLQFFLSFSRISLLNQRGIQYALDAMLAGVLMLASGGLSSPFSFFLGLIVIASGTHAQRTLPLLISILTCVAYLSAVYGELWLMHGAALNAQQALQVLLQVSALMLAGGVMAYIARRHASLTATSDQAIQRHRKLKDLHDKVMAEMREGVILLDQQLRFVDMNIAASTLLKRESLASLLLFPPLAEFFQRTDQHDTTLTAFECEYRRQGQTLLLAVRRLRIDDNAAWLLTMVDINEVRKLEEQLIQQEKMAALGKMAAMLAHEIRNPIQTMTQGLEIIASNPASVGPMQQVFHDEMLRLNRLVSMMLQYSKPLQASAQPTVMAELIEASLQQVDLKQRRLVVWQCRLSELYLDGDHFRLVLDNLLSNALANRSDDRSTVEITLDADHAHWILQVSNQGEIPLAVREKLFEPFISGRSAGVGLGLATVQQVCTVNGWMIEVNTDAGQICFTVRGSFTAHHSTDMETRLEVEHG